MIPVEFVVEVFIAPLKGLLAHELAEMGYSQSKIGQLLGISQPAVSAYLKNPKTYYEEKLLKIIDRRELGRLIRSTKSLVELGSVEEALRYLNNYALTLLSTLRLCQLHRVMHPMLQSCEICKDIHIYTEVVKRVETAFEILRRCNNCYKLVPKVLMNIIELDLGVGVGFPGRIYVEGTQLMVRGKPKPGASRFLTALLQEVNKIHGEIKAVANIAYVAKECIKNKLNVAEVGPSNSEEEIISNVVSVFRREVFDVIYDSGGRGIEPNAYVFGIDAIDVATKIVEIANCIS